MPRFEGTMKEDRARPKACVRNLVEQAAAKGGVDRVTAVLVWLGPTDTTPLRSSALSTRAPATRPRGTTIRRNEGILAPEVLVIDADGAALGIMPIENAIDVARVRGLDLVEINPKATPPVCKILDFATYKYVVRQAAALARRRDEESPPRK